MSISYISWHILISYDSWHVCWCHISWHTCWYQLAHDMYADIIYLMSIYVEIIWIMAYIWYQTIYMYVEIIYLMTYVFIYNSWSICWYLETHSIYVCIIFYWWHKCWYISWHICWYHIIHGIVRGVIGKFADFCSRKCVLHPNDTVFLVIQPLFIVDRIMKLIYRNSCRDCYKLLP